LDQSARTRAGRFGTIAVGLVCAAVGLVLSVGMARTSVAHGLYHCAKYGAAAADPSRVEALTERIRDLHPWHYYAFMRAAASANDAAVASAGETRATWLARSRRWCGEALALNPYRRPLRLLHARLLALESPAEGLKAWQRYVDWEYWNPDNHAELARFHLLAGDFDAALSTLEMARGGTRIEAVREEVTAAWRHEMIAPPEPPGDDARENSLFSDE
jgi:hypothetical protein